MLDLARSRLDDRTIDLAGAHGDAGEADFVQAADGVDIATVLATDEDFELWIDGASVSDEGADHLLDCRGFDHRAEGVRHSDTLFFLDLGGNLDGDFENGLDFGGDDHERDFDFGFRMFAFLNEFGGGVQNGLDLHLGDFGVGDGHTNRAVAEHRVLFLFQAAVVQEELMERRVEQMVGRTCWICG